MKFCQYVKEQMELDSIYKKTILDCKKFLEDKKVEFKFFINEFEFNVSQDSEREFRDKYEELITQMTEIIEEAGLRFDYNKYKDRVTVEVIKKFN
jgi:hypothetical protein